MAWILISWNIHFTQGVSMRVVMIILSILSTAIMAQAQPVDPCANFATKFAVDAVTSRLLLEGSMLWENVIYPEVGQNGPELLSQSKILNRISFLVVVGVSPRFVEPDMAAQTRYYVTVNVSDQGASCPLYGEGIDLYNDIELEN
jgi:hypothetical protein